MSIFELYILSVLFCWLCLIEILIVTKRLTCSTVFGMAMLSIGWLVFGIALIQKVISDYIWNKWFKDKAEGRE